MVWWTSAHTLTDEERPGTKARGPFQVEQGEAVLLYCHVSHLNRGKNMNLVLQIYYTPILHDPNGKFNQITKNMFSLVLSGICPCGQSGFLSYPSLTFQLSWGPRSSSLNMYWNICAISIGLFFTADMLACYWIISTGAFTQYVFYYLVVRPHSNGAFKDTGLGNFTFTPKMWKVRRRRSKCIVWLCGLLGFFITTEWKKIYYLLHLWGILSIEAH